MWQSKNPWIVVLAVALALLLAVPVQAQQGWPQNGSNWGYRGSAASPPSWSPSYQSAPERATVASSPYSNYGDYSFPQTPGEAVVGSPYYLPGQNVSSYQSFYNAGNMTGDRPALLNVRVPARAELWIGDEQVQTKSDTLRQFETPVLERGRVYSYVVRARWEENGKPMEREQKVKFRAGEAANVNLMR